MAPHERMPKSAQSQKLLFEKDMKFTEMTNERSDQFTLHLTQGKWPLVDPVM